MPSRPLISDLRPAGRAVSVVVAVAVAAALLAGGAGVAAAAPAAAPTLVVVTVGAPAEQSFRLTPAKGIPAGRVTFRVTNAGTVPHSFKLCSARLAVTPSAGAPTPKPAADTRPLFMTPQLDQPAPVIVAQPPGAPTGEVPVIRVDETPAPKKP